MKSFSRLSLFVVTLACLSAGIAQAQTVIRSPVAVLQNTAGSFGPDFAIEYTLDQSGLLTGFVSGVTDFDAYLAGSPLHTYFSESYEWFAPQGTASSTIVYDLGDVFSVDRLALWNEEFAGIENLSLEASQTADFAASVNLGSFAIADNPDGENYGAQVLSFTPTSARYFRATVSASNTDLIGIGEVAVGTQASGSPIPEPATFLLIGAAVTAPCARLRRRKRRA